MRRRAFIALALSSVIAGFAATPEANAGFGGAGDFTIEKVFAGRGVGKGVFKNNLSGAMRPFTVRFNGTRTKNGLNLAEDVAYADGQKERHVWRFTRTGPSTYEGRRDDVPGVAKGTISGDTLKLSYDVKLNTGGSTAQVHFEDTLVLHAPGVVLNTATVSKFGIPVGKVDIAIRMPKRRG